MPFPSQDLEFRRDILWSFLCSVKMRGECSFCWYWWNWWPSLFKLSFHKTVTYDVETGFMKVKKAWNCLNFQYLLQLGVYASEAMNWILYTLPRSWITYHCFYLNLRCPSAVWEACFSLVFSSSDPKGHVSYCHHWVSVVCRSSVR